MRYVTIGDVVDLRAELEREGIPATIRMHDACGRQTCTIEVLDTGRESGRDEARESDGRIAARARSVVKGFFERRFEHVRFDRTTGMNFWIDQ